jgi:hypothetical protein
MKTYSQLSKRLKELNNTKEIKEYIEIVSKLKEIERSIEISNKNCRSGNYKNPLL